MKRSKAEIAFTNHWQQYQELFPLEEEFRFHETRRWRCDFVNHEHKLAIEISGAGYGHGGSVKSLQSDTEKIQQLALLGWTYFPILASDCTKRVDVAAIPVIEWINKYTPVKIKVGW